MVKDILIRGGAPLIIMTAMSLWMKFQDVAPDQVKRTFLMGIIITAVAAASVIYDVDKWSIRKQTLVHFLVMLITVYPCLLISGWFELISAVDYLRVFFIFLTVGIMLWSFSYIILRYLLSK